MQRFLYPFSALVEQEAMKTALLLNAVDPGIGGVLIRGHKGAGKSTAARSLAALLPSIEVVEGCPFNSDPARPFPGGEDRSETPTGPRGAVSRPTPFVELPLNATEDRLVGTLHLEKALQTGRRHFEPGLLASAHRGVLYVDEVNLLDDHLVDLLLDVAASGINVVERESLSFTHPARFLLVGTMNPEEGELRPQFLDRFGLCVAVGSVANLEARQAIVQRHLAFERDPAAFAREWESFEQVTAQQILSARQHLDRVCLPDALIALSVRLTHRLQVQGHRADLTLLRAARAHAALLEQDHATTADLTAVAPLALAHRMASSPLESSEQLQERLTRALREAQGEPLETSAPPDALALDDTEAMAEEMQVPGASAAGSIVLSFLKKKSAKPSSKRTG